MTTEFISLFDAVDYTAALDVARTYPQGYRRDRDVGTALLALRQAPEAAEHLRRATQENSFHPDVWRNLGPDAFLDTAAFMQRLDLIVTSDMAIAHLAGALGRPTWLALRKYPEWRWLQDRSDTPWYPSMRLFRQQRRGDWSSVMGRIASATAGLTP